jgi:uncharacterized protein
MDYCVIPPTICIKDTGTPKGKGVFAQRQFEEGEVVEVAPILVLPDAFADLPQLLKTYSFNWQVLAGADERVAIALGYGSLYNHANPANLRYTGDAKLRVMLYTAVRKIEVNEELTINYNTRGGGPVSESDHWFEKNSIQLITAP